MFAIAVNQLGPIFIFHILHSFYHMNFKTFKPFSSFLFYFVFKLYINLIFTACACPLLLLEACNPDSPWGIAFSTSYIGEVFNAFTLGPHNMLAVMVIKSSMDKDGNQNKVFLQIPHLHYTFWAGWQIWMYNDIIRSIKHATIASGIATIVNENWM